jgi:hypothetical protein
LTSPWPHDERVPATTPGRSHHSTLSHGRSHETRASEIWTAAGGRAVPASASMPGCPGARSHRRAGRGQPSGARVEPAVQRCRAVRRWRRTPAYVFRRHHNGGRRLSGRPAHHVRSGEPAPMYRHVPVFPPARPCRPAPGRLSYGATSDQRHAIFGSGRSTWPGRTGRRRSSVLAAIAPPDDAPARRPGQVRAVRRRAYGLYVRRPARPAAFSRNVPSNPAVVDVCGVAGHHLYKGACGPAATWEGRTR